MANYSIKELERLSGIKAHTIRIWEKRYKIISPQRRSGNIRTYSDAEFRKILNVAMLNSQGMKISRIAALSDDEINKLILAASHTSSDKSVYIDQLVVAMVGLDEESFDGVLSTVVAKIGFEKAIMEVVYPFLEKIGVLWQAGSISPAHEHFISSLVRQKIIAAVDALPIPSAKAKRAILFLPEGELHELGLMFLHFMVRSRGFKTYYLGPSVPYQDLKAVFHVHHPQLLITSITSYPLSRQLEKFLKSLASDFPEALIIASGLQIRRTAFHVPPNVRLFYTVAEVPALLASAS